MNVLPPWFDNTTNELINKLWMIDNNPENVHNYLDLKYNLNIYSKHIKYECITDNKLKFNDFNFKQVHGNDKIGLEIHKSILKEQYDNEVNKILLLKDNINNDQIELNKYCGRILDEKEAKAKNVILKRIDSNNKTILNKPNKLKEVMEDKCNNIHHVLRTTMVQIKPSKKQINIIAQWMDIAKQVYDFCVDYYNSQNGKISLQHFILRDYVIKNINIDLSECPYNIFAYEIKTFCENVKSCLTNYKRKHIGNYNMGHKNTTKSQTIIICSQNINKKGFYTTKIGEMYKIDKDFLFENVVCDSKLTYNKKLNKYYLYCPQYRDKKDVNKEKEVVSLDPGEKVFMAFYGLDHCGKIGEDIREKIIKIETEIRKVQRKISKIKNHKYVPKKKSSTSNNTRVKRFKKVINKKYKKIKDLVKELHNKTALFLCKNYKRIILPIFETSKMVCDKIKNKQELKKELEGKSKKQVKVILKQNKRKKRLNRRVKFVLNMLSHYKFKQHLLNKAEEYGCKVEIVDESYTSMMCGYCGKLSKNYQGRIKHCSLCKKTMERDYNGSRNILIKNINLLVQG